MKQEIIEQLDGYEQTVREIAVNRKYGSDFTTEKGAVAEHINRLHPDRIDAAVLRVIDETATAKTFRLAPSNRRLPPFLAGQYIALYLDIGGIRTSRPYSISSPPNRTGYYEITVRRVDGGLVSNFLLDEIRAGDRLSCSGPAGHFYHNPLIHKKTMVCIAGGSGITPFMSMIREIADRRIDREVFLLYGNAAMTDVIFHEEIQEIARHCDRIHYFPVIENPGPDYTGHCGYITSDILRDILPNVGHASVFVCGPQGLYDFCLPELEGLGIPERRVRREMYGPPADIGRQPGWPAGLSPGTEFTVDMSDGRRFNAAAGTPLLTSMEKAGMILPSLCRSGECSMCRVRILSGRVYQPPGVPVRSSDTRFGYVHACVSYPLSDLTVLA
jgi:glycine betaine catabolism B